MASMTALAGSADCVAYTAVCQREGGWWVITVPELDAGGVTQARTLDEVPETVADLVATMTGADPANVEVTVQAHAGPGLDPSRIGRVALALAGIALAWRAIRDALVRH
jgi:hypothetical protein